MIYIVSDDDSRRRATASSAPSIFTRATRWRAMQKRTTSLGTMTIAEGWALRAMIWAPSNVGGGQPAVVQLDCQGPRRDSSQRLCVDFDESEPCAYEGRGVVHVDPALGVVGVVTFAPMLNPTEAFAFRLGELRWHIR